MISLSSTATSEARVRRPPLYLLLQSHDVLRLCVVLDASCRFLHDDEISLENVNTPNLRVHLSTFLGKRWCSFVGQTRGFESSFLGARAAEPHHASEAAAQRTRDLLCGDGQSASAPSRGVLPVVFRLICGRYLCARDQ